MIPIQAYGTSLLQYNFVKKLVKMQNQPAPLVDLDNSRVPDQRKEMEEILASGHCPFCPEHLGKHHPLPTLKEGKFWILTPNQWPYEHTKVHLLAIYRTHAEDLSDLDPNAGKELLELMQWSQNEFTIPGGGWVMRFGDTRYSAGSVQHIHAQCVQPDIHDPNYKPVRIKIGKSPDKLGHQSVST